MILGSNMAPLALPSSATNITIKLRPSVLLNICDSYVRRSENQERVVGTLLGTHEGNTVEIKDCYAVPFNESQEQVRKALHSIASANFSCYLIENVVYLRLLLPC